MKKLYFITIVFFLIPYLLLAQISVDTNLNDNDLIQTLGGPGVAISNVNITGAVNSYGRFTNGGDLGINQGVLITSGSIQKAVGPNNVSDASVINNTAGSQILDDLGQGTTLDACEVTFNIVPEGNSISFNYVFGSEEYNEYVDSSFNDVFGFFISGPGINGDQNMALIPNTNTPVAINTVNNGKSINCVQSTNLYTDNCNGQSVQYDGFTTVFQASANNLIPCQTYTITLAIADVTDRRWDSGAFIQQGSFSSNTSIAFHFEHQDGTPDKVFGICEDVYLNGSATLNTGNYVMSIGTRNSNSQITWLSAVGPINGNPDWVNVTQTFKNHPTSPVNFQVGVTYAVMIAINDPNCGWIQVIHDFDLEVDPMSSQFTIEKYVCHDGLFDVTVSAQDTEHSNQFILYETTGGTDDDDTIFPAIEVQSFVTTATFTNLNQNKKYYIKHGVWGGNCGWQETRKLLEPPCCEVFKEVNFKSDTKEGNGNYSITVRDFTLYDDINATHEWYILTSPNETEGPYTPVHSTTTTGEGPHTIISDAAFGIYYTVVHKVVSNCGELCYSSEFFHKPSKSLFSKPKSSEVDCCLVFEFWPNGVGDPQDFSADFGLSYDAAQDIIYAYIPAEFQYPNNPGITTEWRLYTSESPDEGPYTLVDTQYGDAYSYGPPIEDGLYYFLIRKLIHECAEVCYAQSVSSNPTKDANIKPGPIDCGLIDDLCICDDPTLSVITAQKIKGCYYIVGAQSTINCGNDDIVSELYTIDFGDGTVYHGTSNLVYHYYDQDLPTLYMVTMTYTVIDINGCENTVTQKNRIGIDCGGYTKIIKDVSIAPNPNNGNMSFTLETNISTNVKIDVYDLYGVLKKTFVKNITKNLPLTFTWDGHGILPSGVYFVTFEAEDEMIYKKIIVE